MGDEPVQEPTPEKKKRPPRKKKKNHLVPLETTDEAIEKSGPVFIETLIVKKVDEDNQREEKREEESAEKKSPSDEGEPDSVPDEEHVSPSRNAKESNWTEKRLAPGKIPPKTSYVPEKNISRVVANPPFDPKTLNPHAKTWNVNPSVKPVLQASVSKQPTTTQITTVVPTPSDPVVKAPYTPTPGSWASMAAGNGISRSITNSSAHSVSKAPHCMNVSNPSGSLNLTLMSPQPQPNSALRSIPLSPDWRNHVMPTHRKVLSPKKSVQQLTPPPPVPQSERKVWPSLGDFPPPPGAKQDAPMGAWGTKS